MTQSGPRRVNTALTRRIGWSHCEQPPGDLAMLPEHRTLLEDELCPVADQTLGEMYRASPYGLSQLIATLSPTARILLALFATAALILPRSDWRSRQPARKMNSLGWAATRVRFYSSDRGKPRSHRPLMSTAVEKLLCRPRQFANLGQSRTRKIGIQTDRIWHISVRMRSRITINPR